MVAGLPVTGLLMRAQARRQVGLEQSPADLKLVRQPELLLFDELSPEKLPKTALTGTTFATKSYSHVSGAKPRRRLSSLPL